MVSEALERALQFLRNHKDVALATSEGDIPKLRIFQVCIIGAGSVVVNAREIEGNPKLQEAYELGKSIG